MGKSEFGYKHAAVTGASSGIGRAIAIELSRRNDMAVTAIGRNREKLQVLADDFGIRALPANLHDTDRLIEALEESPVDILVSNAGILPAAVPFQAMQLSDIDAMIETNLAATIRLVHCVLPRMIECNRGHLFFIGSSAGRWPHPNVAVYGATKAAISMFCDSLRCDLAGTGIRVTELCPGRVQTGLYEDMMGKEAVARLYDGHSPIQPEEIAGLLGAALDAPQHVNVSRLEVFPTTQSVGGSQIVKAPGRGMSTNIGK